MGRSSSIGQQLIHLLLMAAVMHRALALRAFPAGRGGCDPNVLLPAETARAVFVAGGPDPSLPMSRDLPLTLTRLPEFDHDDGFGFVASFRNAFLAGEWSSIYDCRVEYFAGGCRAWMAEFPMARIQTMKPIQLGRAVVVSQFWGYGYYHWLIECFLRLMLVYDFLVANPDVKIVMYSMPNADSFLKLIGLDPARLVPFDDTALYFAQELLSPSPSACGSAIGPATKKVMALFRSNAVRLIPELAEPAKHEFTIVVQSRGRDGEARSIINEAELLTAIRRENPDARIVEFGPHNDLWETIRIHHHADIVIGPHGAGLSNILFAREDTAMIELHPDVGNDHHYGRHNVNICHQRTAHRVGAREVLLIEDNGTYATPFSVNIDRVVRTVSDLRRGVYVPVSVPDPDKNE